MTTANRLFIGLLFIIGVIVGGTFTYIADSTHATQQAAEIQSLRGKLADAESELEDVQEVLFNVMQRQAQLAKEADKPIDAEVMPEEERAEEVIQVRPGAVGADGPRSGKWPTLQKKYATAHPKSEWKNSKAKSGRINVHHTISVHWARKTGHPWLELCMANLITLDAEYEHLEYGHAGNFRRFNLDIKHDASLGKFDSRGISDWPGDQEMLEFLQYALGPPSDTEPKELPAVLDDPLPVWRAFQKQKKAPIKASGAWKDCE